MTRALYRSLLWLHPPDFRRKFAGEMLWLFDEAAPGEGPLGLIGDGLLSLARQWVIRWGAWKVMAAIAGAILELAVVAPLITVDGPGNEARIPMPLPHSLNAADVEFSRGLALLVLLVALATAARCLLLRSRDRRRI